MFVSASLPCAKQHIVVLDGKSKNLELQRLAEVFMLLKDLVSNDAIKYKHLQ